MQYFNIVVLFEKLDPSELPVSTVEMSEFGSELTIIFERVTLEARMGVNLVIDPTPYFLSCSCLPSDGSLPPYFNFRIWFRFFLSC